MSSSSSVCKESQSVVLAKQLMQSELSQTQKESDEVMAKVMGTLRILTELLSDVDRSHDNGENGAAKNILEAKGKLALISNWVSENENVIGSDAEQQMLGRDGVQKTPASILKEVEALRVEVEKDVAKLKKEVEVKVKKVIVSKLLPNAKELFKLKKEVEGLEKLLNIGKQVLRFKEVKAIAENSEINAKDILKVKAYLSMVQEAAGIIGQATSHLPPKEKKALLSELSSKMHQMKANLETWRNLSPLVQSLCKEYYGAAFKSNKEAEIKEIGASAAKIDAADRVVANHKEILS